MQPRSRIGILFVNVPAPSCYLRLLGIWQMYITSCNIHFFAFRQFSLDRRAVLPVLFEGIDGSAFCRCTIIYRIDSHQFQVAQWCSQQHILTTFWEVGLCGSTCSLTLSFRVIVRNACHYSAIPFWLIGSQIGVEVCHYFICRRIFIIRLCLVWRNPYVIWVKYALGRLQIPQPTGTGTRTTCQLSSPLGFTIYIEWSITIAIRIYCLGLFIHYAILTIFLIEFFTPSKLQHIGCTIFFPFGLENIASIEVNGIVALKRVGDIDDIISCFCSRGNFRWICNKDKRFIGCSWYCLFKSISIPIVIVNQWAPPCSRQFKSVISIITNTTFYNLIFPINQRIGERKDNRVDIKLDGLTVRHVLQGNLLGSSSLSTLFCQEEWDSNIGTCRSRTGCRQVFVAIGILHLYIVWVTAVEIPQIVSICYRCLSIGYRFHSGTIVY